MVFRVDRRHLNTCRAEAVTPQDTLRRGKTRDRATIPSGVERHRTGPPASSLTGFQTARWYWLSSGSLTLFTGAWSPYLTDANKHLNMCAVVVAQASPHIEGEHRKGKMPVSCRRRCQGPHFSPERTFPFMKTHVWRTGRLNSVSARTSARSVIGGGIIRLLHRNRTCRYRKQSIRARSWLC